MKPYWFEKVMSGEKIYEYRNRFPNEKIEAYIYVSNPVKAIAGIIYLDPRIKTSDWLKTYEDNKEVSERIKHYMKKNAFAMPIVATQRIQPISSEKMKATVEKFIIPESYYYLDNYPDILNAINENLIFKERKSVTELQRFQSESEICRNYNEEK